MATAPILIISTPPAAAEHGQCVSAGSRPFAISDYWALTKLEVNLLIVADGNIGSMEPQLI